MNVQVNWKLVFYRERDNVQREVGREANTCCFKVFKVRQHHEVGVELTKYIQNCVPQVAPGFTEIRAGFGSQLAGTRYTLPKGMPKRVK